MEMNTTTSLLSVMHDHVFSRYIRSINFLLSCTGLLFNLILIVLLIFIGRHQCTTYFLLILMTICDFLYCAVYVSIMLTVEQYINIINYQIICPLSFFLTPFTFTGSTLLLFICLLHFITNYVRRYATTLGQIGGRLSVVFVLAFIIIRSVLGSTSIELIPDSDISHLQICTIDMNTPAIVTTVQIINHIFAEVTDILVYIGWIIILIIYLINLSFCKKVFSFNRAERNSSSAAKLLSFPSLWVLNNNHDRHSIEVIPMELTDISNIINEITTTTTTTTVAAAAAAAATAAAAAATTATVAAATTTAEAAAATTTATATTATTAEAATTTTTTAAATTGTTTNKQRHNDVSLIILSISFISIIFYSPIMIYKYSTIYFLCRDKTLLTEQQTFFLQISQHAAHLFCLSIRFLPYFIFDKRIRLLLNQMIEIKCMAVERTRRRTLSRTEEYKLKHKYIWHYQCHRRQQTIELHNNNEEEQQNE